MVMLGVSATALNGATLTGMVTGSDFLVVYYDADLNGGSMVVSAVDTGTGTVLEGTDSELIMMTLAMSAADYANVAAGNFGFVA